MNWKYYCPRTWDEPRQVWEEVHLLPDDPSYKGEAIWLTVDALGDAQNPAHGSDRAAFQEEALQKLGDNAFHIEVSDMIVRQTDFSMPELVEFARLFLTQQGKPVNEMVEGTLDEFFGR